MGRLSDAARTAVRRRQARRRMAAYHQQRQAVDEAAGGYIPQRSLAAMRQETAAQEEEPAAPFSARDGVVHVLLVTAATVLALFAVGQGFPVLGHSWQWVNLASFGFAAIVATWITFDHVYRRQVPVRWWAVTAAVAALTLTTFTLGAARSIVIDGTIYSDTSEVARAYRLAEQVQADRAQMAAYDELLALDDVAARARFKEFEPAAEQLRKLSVHYAKMAQNPSSLPDATFGQIVVSMAAAGNYGAEAMTRREQLLLTADARVASELEQARGAFVQAHLTAGELLPEAARLVGFEMGPTQSGPVE